MAITIEFASDPKPPYAFKPVVYERLVKLCMDICKRNGEKRRHYDTPKPAGCLSKMRDGLRAYFGCYGN